MDERAAARLARLILAFALAAAGLVVSIPPLFGPHEPYQAWLTGALAIVTVALAVATFHVRRTATDPDE